MPNQSAGTTMPPEAPAPTTARTKSPSKSPSRSPSAPGEIGPADDSDVCPSDPFYIEDGTYFRAA
ncbi:hypothetical protein BFJ63_vAg10605 [Fusarium oxysporum f. sp. narcissi]|uniref:Uncharacterized protein n=1 Tax=Fusarium oxysporum f. sp. narcissi TaxID=451672 RepID=A0A4Q2VJI1_FUSOX|nr:hypothetical protein BFJ63_vAg10605 [Fusarium oxysporum f. sp. narcissi]